MFTCKHQSKEYMNDFIRALSTSAVSADLPFLEPKKFQIEFFFSFQWMKSSQVQTKHKMSGSLKVQPSCSDPAVLLILKSENSVPVRRDIPAKKTPQSEPITFERLMLPARRLRLWSVRLSWFRRRGRSELVGENTKSAVKLLQCLSSNKILQLDRWKSDISHIHLGELPSKVFSVGLLTTQPISALLVTTKVGNDCCKLPVITIEEETEELPA